MMNVENVIVGAGPYGLSIAAHFRANNIEALIIGRPMASWRDHMPAGMILKSETFASNLSDPQRRYTFENFYKLRGTLYRAVGKPLSIGDFIAYADWFRERAAAASRGRPRRRLVQPGDLGASSAVPPVAAAQARPHRDNELGAFGSLVAEGARR